MAVVHRLETANNNGVVVNRVALLGIVSQVVRGHGVVMQEKAHILSIKMRGAILIVASCTDGCIY